VKTLGQGSYGVVIKAIHRKTRNVVAIKIVYDLFNNVLD